MLVLLFFVKEEDTSIKLKLDANQYIDEKAKKKAQKEAAKAQKAALKATKLTASERKSLLFMLGCLFFLFCTADSSFYCGDLEMPITCYCVGPQLAICFV